MSQVDRQIGSMNAVELVYYRLNKGGLLVRVYRYLHV